VILALLGGLTSKQAYPTVASAAIVGFAAWAAFAPRVADGRTPYERRWVARRNTMWGLFWVVVAAGLCAWRATYAFHPESLVLVAVPLVVTLPSAISWLRSDPLASRAPASDG
jgi:hypothetical protein